jgi:KaiC/GvpD/RAD55 family RecA-like ATPase
MVEYDDDDARPGFYERIANRLPPGVLRRPGDTAREHALAEAEEAADRASGRSEIRYFAAASAQRNVESIFPTKRAVIRKRARSQAPDVLDPQDCAASPPRGYVVKGMVAPGDLMLIFGQPGAGKSIIAPHIGYAVARGDEVFGRRVRQGRVLYVAAEDPHGMRQRVHALLLELGDAPDFLLVTGISDLLGSDSPDPDEIRQLVTALKPVLVIVDTIAAAFPGLRENEAEDMGNVVRFARSITELGPAVVLVHHAPKADDATPRGHGSLNGDADVAIRLIKSAGEVIGTFSKNRNGPSDATLGFAIKAVEIGADEDGESITAPTLTEQVAKPPGKRPLTPAEDVARRYLADLIVTSGNPLPAGSSFPAGLRGVPEDTWRDECESRRLSTAETEETAPKSSVSEGILAIAI